MAVFLAEALCDRLLDYEENVRKGVVAALCDVATHSPDAIPVDTIKVVAERVRDKSVGFSLLFSIRFCFRCLFSSVRLLQSMCILVKKKIAAGCEVLYHGEVGRYLQAILPEGF